MPRALSSAFRNELEASQTADSGVIFLTIDHDDLASPLRLNSDNCDYIYLSQRYTGVSFSLRLLTDTERPPRAQGAIMNVDRTLAQLIDPPDITLILLASSSFGALNMSLTPPARPQIGTPTVQYQAAGLRLQNARVNALTVTFDLNSRDYSSEIFPGLTASKARCPGLYR